MADLRRSIRAAAPASIERIDWAWRSRSLVAVLSVVRVKRRLTRDCAHCSVTALTVAAHDPAALFASSTFLRSDPQPPTSTAATTTHVRADGRATRTGVASRTPTYGRVKLARLCRDSRRP